jgi:hypothetical protein
LSERLKLAFLQKEVIDAHFTCPWWSRGSCLLDIIGCQKRLFAASQM